MSGETNYQISLQFSSYETMLKHLHEYGEFLMKLQPAAAAQLRTATPTDETAAAPPRPPRRENERRGKHTAHYHELAREYRAEHPELPYRECYKIVSHPRGGEDPAP
jgi:hypothetical protein